MCSTTKFPDQKCLSTCSITDKRSRSCLLGCDACWHLAAALALMLQYGVVHTLSSWGVQNILPHLCRSTAVGLEWRFHPASGHGGVLVEPWQGISCHVAASNIVRAQSAGWALQSRAGVSARGVVRGAAALAQGGHLSCGLPFVGNHTARVGDAAPGPVGPLPVSALQGRRGLRSETITQRRPLSTLPA